MPFLTTWQGFLCGSARKAAGVPYPFAYPTREEYKSSVAAKRFYGLQRAHGNTLEAVSGFLFALLFAGLFQPRLAASFGALWVVGRVVYTLGYALDAKKRMYGYVQFSVVKGRL